MHRMKKPEDLEWESRDGIGLVGPCRGAVEQALEQMKEAQLAAVLAMVDDAGMARYLQRVANEAAAIAWCTTFPVLVLPGLLEEKLRGAMTHWRRQQQLWEGTRLAV